MLEMKNVWKSFNGQDVLRGVDLDVGQGEFVSFIGHSGCGKSTLLNVVGGLLEADSGAVSLDGKAITDPGPDRAMVFQNYSLLPRLSLLANVREAARAARPDARRPQTDEVVERYLTAVGLWEHKDKRPAQVSGGMQQRTAVARAFAVSPAAPAARRAVRGPGRADPGPAAAAAHRAVAARVGDRDRAHGHPRHRRGHPAGRPHRRHGQPAQPVDPRHHPRRPAPAPRPAPA